MVEEWAFGTLPSVMRLSDPGDDGPGAKERRERVIELSSPAVASKSEEVAATKGESQGQRSESESIPNCFFALYIRSGVRSRPFTPDSCSR